MPEIWASLSSEIGFVSTSIPAWTAMVAWAFSQEERKLKQKVKRRRARKNCQFQLRQIRRRRLRKYPPVKLSKIRIKLERRNSTLERKVSGILAMIRTLMMKMRASTMTRPSMKTWKTTLMSRNLMRQWLKCKVIRAHQWKDKTLSRPLKTISNL